MVAVQTTTVDSTTTNNQDGHGRCVFVCVCVYVSGLHSSSLEFGRSSLVSHRPDYQHQQQQKRRLTCLSGASDASGQLARLFLFVLVPPACCALRIAS